MPFPDEAFMHRVVVTEYRAEWDAEGRALVGRIRGLVPDAVAVDHIGSTSVPGLAAKDCLDVMVQVPGVESADLSGLASAGFRERPEPWNRSETTDGETCAKRVFAAPVGERLANVHVRAAGGPNVAYALLFRDFLRADDRAREAWGGFKVRLAQSVPDLMDYGQIKASVQPLLMAAARRWRDG